MLPGPAKGSLANVTRLGSGAVAAGRGDETYHPQAAAEAARSRRTDRAPLGTNGDRIARVVMARRVRFVPAAVVRLLSESDAARKGKATGGRAEQASNIARGTPENWRTCGHDNTSGAFRRASLRFGAARCQSPRVRQGPGVPRALPSPRARSFQNSDAATRRENEEGCLKRTSLMSNARAANSLSPLPVAGEGIAKRKSRLPAAHFAHVHPFPRAEEGKRGEAFDGTRPPALR